MNPTPESDHSDTFQNAFEKWQLQTGPNAESITSEAFGAIPGCATDFRTPCQRTFDPLGAPPYEHNIRTLLEPH